MNKWTMYCSILIVVILTLKKLYQHIKLLQLPIVLTLCIYGGFLFYVSSLLPGILKILSPVAIVLTFIMVSMLTLIILSRTASIIQPPGGGYKPENWHQSNWSGTNIFLGLLGIVGLSPILQYFYSFLRVFILNTQIVLPWDTVSYHLPALIEFVQDRSLWSIEGPFQGYSFGYELIANLPTVIFHTHWAIIVANGYAIIFLLAAIELIVRQIARIVHSINYIVTLFITISIWSNCFAGELYKFGKNDIFLSACLLSSFGLLLEILWINNEFTKHDKHRYYALLILSTIAIGLGLATKPTSLAYIPVILFGLIMIIRSRNFGSANKFRLGFVSVSIFMGGFIAIGGFFYIRNLLIWGQINPPSLIGSWKLSLIANLANPALYAPKIGSIIFFFSLLSLVCTLLLWLKNRTDKRLILFLIFTFQVVSLIAFAITPFVVLYDSSNVLWQLRLGMPFFIIVFISYAVSTYSLLNQIEYRFPKLYKNAFFVLLFLCGIFISYRWVQKPSEGLPGYEKVKSLAPTNIYRWVQEMEEPQRIYSAGLRPYGLYGKEWQHHLFYDLHSFALLPEVNGKRRIATILKQFHPTLILISVDPHSWENDSLEKPLIGWMRTRKQCFLELYTDDTVSGFKVLDDCQEIIEGLATDQKIEMGN